MNKLNALRNALLVKREEGQGMVEYSLILALVSVAAIGILGFVGGEVNTVFTTVRDALAP